mmetsp:Transcript_47836/g.113889  ORF Transcript_47836/g.113889 Transcript_47836/m.113889 type:complete len:256 (+) Transcript_47836:37-804(+)
MRPLVSPAAAFNVLQDLSLVFVYGTLKRGLFNSKHLKTSIHIGAARTASKLPLITDEYYVPYLLHLPGTGHRIDGELWAVDDSVLATLDKLEGVPHYYERHRQEVEATSVTSPARLLNLAPWVYMLPGHKVTDEHLSQEMLPNYEPSLHHAHYVPRAHRAKTQGNAAFSSSSSSPEGTSRRLEPFSSSSFPSSPFPTSSSSFPSSFFPSSAPSRGGPTSLSLFNGSKGSNGSNSFNGSNAIPESLQRKVDNLRGF